MTAYHLEYHRLRDLLVGFYEQANDAFSLELIADKIARTGDAELTEEVSTLCARFRRSAFAGIEVLQDAAGKPLPKTTGKGARS